ncbi:tetratricopeptide repeat protein [Undibacterium griseum]|uniref:Tetratricopeptide repeat protein n=1 Tax=Undibacterium griseum TaxID=2762295 RepID=A0ABR6YLQ6_9BURK|nr:tetratricopeptide repeat protein [Undibacterium griseum]MBC3884827.1 tetratricopeptide repeat protein [Undibacterium griseum]
MRLPLLSAVFILLPLLLGACASTPPLARNGTEFQDHLFQPPAHPVRSQDILSVSQEMQHFLTHEVAHSVRNNGLRRGLYNALTNGWLTIDYDTEITKNASETFQTRSGNCLSLVLMTAALAKQLDLKVDYQNVFLEDSWTQADNLYIATGHVNVIIGKRPSHYDAEMDNYNILIIDFSPAQQAIRQKSESITEARVLSMYLNNRAVELLSTGNINDAYWYIKEAIRQDPAFYAAYNTLGVVYRRHGDILQAEQIFREILQASPDNVIALSNLQETLEKSAHYAEADSIAQRLHKLQPHPPFYFLNLAKAEMQHGNLTQAKNFIEKEIQRDPYNDESHFLLAQIHYQLGEMSNVEKQLLLARENSSTRKTYDLYSSKLNFLKAQASISPIK